MDVIELAILLKKANADAANIQAIKDLVVNNEMSWSAIKGLVENGLFAEWFKVGDQISSTWKKAAATEYTAPWDVVHIENGEPFLKWHYAVPDGVPFDEPEAIYYFDGTETAGTYHITIGTAYGTGWVKDDNIEFTLSEKPDEGDQLVINCGAANSNDPTNGRTWNVYAKGSKTSKQTGTTSKGSGGTNLGTIAPTNVHKTNGRLNAISRVVYGSGRWSESQIRQWLNSAAAADEWWEPKNNWDRPSAITSTLNGFLWGYDEEFLNILTETEVVTALNTQEGFDDTTETTMDKIFLPSLEQMYVSPQLAGEGTEWDYFKQLAADAGRTGKYAQGGTYDELKTYNVSSTSSAVFVWLRSCYRGYASIAWCVNYSGSVTNNNANRAYRGCPACQLKKSNN